MCVPSLFICIIHPQTATDSFPVMVGRYLPKYTPHSLQTYRKKYGHLSDTTTVLLCTTLYWVGTIYIIYIHVPCCDSLNNSHVPLFSLRGREIPRTCLQRLHHIVHIAGWFVWDLIAKEKKEKNHVEVASLRQLLHVHVRCSID